MINKEIYFSNFFTEEIIEFSHDDLNSQNEFKNEKGNEKTSKNKMIKTMLTYKEKKLFKECLVRFRSNWEKMKLIAKYNKKTFFSKDFVTYFKRPFYSRFLLSENLKLYSFNSCIPIPHVLTNYQMKIEIEYDKETIFPPDVEKEKYQLIPYKTSISLITV